MTRRKRNEDKSCQRLTRVDKKTLRVDFEREIEWLRAKRDEVWQRVALLERVAGGDHVEDGDDGGKLRCVRVDDNDRRAIAIKKMTGTTMKKMTRTTMKTTMR